MISLSLIFNSLNIIYAIYVRANSVCINPARISLSFLGLCFDFFYYLENSQPLFHLRFPLPHFIFSFWNSNDTYVRWFAIVLYFLDALFWVLNFPFFTLCLILDHFYWIILVFIDSWLCLVYWWAWPCILHACYHVFYFQHFLNSFLQFPSFSQSLRTHDSQIDFPLIFSELGFSLLQSKKKKKWNI